MNKKNYSVSLYFCLFNMFNWFWEKVTRTEFDVVLCQVQEKLVKCEDFEYFLVSLLCDSLCCGQNETFEDESFLSFGHFMKNRTINRSDISH